MHQVPDQNVIPGVIPPTEEQKPPKGGNGGKDKTFPGHDDARKK